MKWQDQTRELDAGGILQVPSCEAGVPKIETPSAERMTSNRSSTSTDNSPDAIVV